jgi:hypothetical protein
MNEGRTNDERRMKEPYPSLPKYDNEHFESSFRVCIVGFGEGDRRSGGAGKGFGDSHEVILN